MNGHVSLRTYGAIILVPCIVVASLVILSLLPEEQVINVVRENGLVELLTVVIYAGVIGCLALLFLHKKRPGALAASGIVLLLCLRELDFHSRFTTMGIFKTKFYVSPEVPLPEKVIVSIVVLGLLAAVLVFIRQYWKDFFLGLQQKDTSMIAVACGLGCAVLSKMLDSMSHLFRPLCFWYNPAIMSRAIEETLELAIPLFFLVAIYYSYKKHSR